MDTTMEREELETKLRELGVTQERIDEADELDGSLGIADLAETTEGIIQCSYLENDQYFVKLA